VNGDKIMRPCLVSLLLTVGIGCSDDDGEGGANTSIPETTTGVATTDMPSESSSEGGETSVEETGVLVVDYEGDVQPIWNGNCLCHMQNASGMMQAPLLTLNAGLSYDELVGAASEQLPGMDRVTPGEPEESYLWHKLQGTHLDVGGMGDSMPQVGQLDAEDLAVIEAWIAAGAMP
jgi:hypothetical protein